jgi:hypothetical protein
MCSGGKPWYVTQLRIDKYLKFAHHHIALSFGPGTIVVVDRGECQFSQKALMAEQNQANSLVVVNKGKGTIRMAVPDPEPNIPAVMISEEDGNALKELLSSGSWLARIIPKGLQ